MSNFFSNENNCLEKMFSPSLLCSHKEVSDCDPVAMLNTYLAKSLNLLQLIYHINHFGRKFLPFVIV